MRDELLWAYCVMRPAEPCPRDVSGVHEDGCVYEVTAAGLLALVSRVPRAEFGEQPLRRNLNDLQWLERVARAHESVLERALSAGTIVPLRLCTLYETDDGVREMLARERAAFDTALDHLAGREEWGVKALIDPARLTEAASSRVGSGSEDRPATGEGGAYLLRRRHEREAREAARSLAVEVAEHVHERVAALALGAVTRPPQNRDLSGYEGTMVLNGAYLVESSHVNELRSLAAQLESEFSELGVQIDVTGPWPPYNFVPEGGTVAIT